MRTERKKKEKKMNESFPESSVAEEYNVSETRALIGQK